MEAITQRIPSLEPNPILRTYRIRGTTAQTEARVTQVLDACARGRYARRGHCGR